MWIRFISRQRATSRPLFWIHDQVPQTLALSILHEKYIEKYKMKDSLTSKSKTRSMTWIQPIIAGCLGFRILNPN